MIQKDYGTSEMSSAKLSYAERRRIASSLGSILGVMILMAWWAWHEHDQSERMQGGILVLCLDQCFGEDIPGALLRENQNSKADEETKRAIAVCNGGCAAQYEAGMAEINTGLWKYYPPSYLKPMRDPGSDRWW